MPYPWLEWPSCDFFGIPKPLPVLIFSSTIAEDSAAAPQARADENDKNTVVACGAHLAHAYKKQFPDGADDAAMTSATLGVADDTDDVFDHSMFHLAMAKVRQTKRAFGRSAHIDLKAPG